MTRYQPTAAEQDAIKLLKLAGYAVVRQRTYDRLQERVRIAELRQAWETERQESAQRWARRECDEQRRLADRLTRVAAAAAALGVSIQDINAALGSEDSR